MFVVEHHSPIMAGGVTIDPSVTALWKDIKIRSSKRYAILKIKQYQSVVIDDENQPATWSEEDEIVFNKLKSVLDPKEPRYIVYVFYVPRDERMISSFPFISWYVNIHIMKLHIQCPD